MPIITIPKAANKEQTISKLIQDKDCDLGIYVTRKPNGMSVQFTIVNFDQYPYLNLAFLEIQNPDLKEYIQIGKIPNDILQHNDSFKFSNPGIITGTYNFINQVPEDVNLYVTTAEICQLLNYLVTNKQESDETATNAVIELIYCRYGALILAIINYRLFFRPNPSVEIQSRTQFFSYLCEELDRKKYRLFTVYDPAVSKFTTWLGINIHWMCSEIIGENNKYYTTHVRILSESLGDLVVVPDTQINLTDKNEINTDIFYGTLLKEMIEKRKSNEEKKRFYEYRFGVTEMGVGNTKDKDIVTFMFWKNEIQSSESRLKEFKNLDFYFFSQLVKEPNAKKQEELLEIIKKLIPNNPEEKAYLQGQYELIEKLDLNFYKSLDSQIKTKCNSLVKAKNRDKDEILQKFTGLTEDRFVELTRNPTEAKLDSLKLAIKKELSETTDKALRETLGKEIATLEKLDMKEFLHSTDYIMFRSFFARPIQKIKKINPDEETNENQ